MAARLATFTAPPEPAPQHDHLTFVLFNSHPKPLWHRLSQHLFLDIDNADGDIPTAVGYFAKLFLISDGVLGLLFVGKL